MTPHLAFSDLDRIVERTLPFTAADGRAFVQVAAASIDGHHSLPVRSTAFREWFFTQCYSEFQTIPSAHALSAIRNHLEARASADPNCTLIRVSRRVTSRDNPTQKILLDLSNPEGQFVEITSAGFQTTAANGVHFETSRSTFPLPEPAQPTPESPTAAVLDNLRATLNLGPPDGPTWLRSFAWLLNAFRPHGPYPILILRGPSASGKSLAARILRTLIDPNAAPFTPIPSTSRDLLSLAQHNWVLAFDHISTLKPHLSDTLCRLSTGTTIAIRDQPGREPAQLAVARPILLTVTHAFTPSPDLAARALIVDLPALTPETRRPEQDLHSALSRDFPAILGALCDTISTLLRDPQPFQPHPTRHADALAWTAPAHPAIRDAFDVGQVCNLRRVSNPPPPEVPPTPRRQPSSPPARYTKTVLYPRDALLAQRARWRDDHKKVVFTNGCYDLLHPGHIRLLEQARSLGDILILGLNSDASVQRSKGPTRPLLPQEERAAIADALQSVDAVTFFDEDTPRELIAALLPDILVKGADWTHFVAGKEEVEAAGGKVLTLPLEPGYSTTNIVESILIQP